MPPSAPALVCLGYGYTASALARRLVPDGWRILGTTRSHAPDSEKHRSIIADGVEPVVWDADQALAPALAQASHILVSIPPGEEGCPALRTFKPWVKAQQDAAPRLRWIGYLSSNGVYGDHGGAWVDENTPPAPTRARGRRRLDAEQGWLRLGTDFRLPVQVFRLPGIYGPGRSPIDQIRAGTARRIVKPGQVFSRMHVDDIAMALHAAMVATTTLRLFNLADNEPAPPQEVILYACDLMGVTPPPEQSLEAAGLSEMGRSFYADNKRVSNRRMREVLGVSPDYPSYREGLQAILASQTP